MKLLRGLIVSLLFLLPFFAQAETLPAEHADKAVAEENTSPENEMSSSQPDESEVVADDISPEEETAPEEFVEEEVIADPLEPWNRLVFTFNDRFYYWLFKPMAKGYNAVFPEELRVEVRNFFHNITMPIRFVNSLLQGELKSAGNELIRFGINSTFGFAGFFDCAKTHFNINGHEGDLGLTLGHYGAGNGFYIILPFLGPSSLRDSIGMIGDGFLDPVNYVSPAIDVLAIHSYSFVNDGSLRLGEYEDLTASAVEPYVALRDAYAQHRWSLIKK